MISLRIAARPSRHFKVIFNSPEKAINTRETNRARSDQLEMGSKDDLSDEWETDEESTVVVKLSGVIQDEFIRNMTSEKPPKCTYLGLDEDQALLQFGDDIFRGHYSHSAGTNIVLEATPTSTAGSESMTVELCAVTEKQLEMKRLYIQGRQPAADSSSGAVMEGSSSAITEQAPVDQHSDMGTIGSTSAEAMETNT